MAKYNYDFEVKTTPEEINNMSYKDVELINSRLRTNLHIVKCCNNCGYYRRSGATLGHCVIPFKRHFSKRLLDKFPQVPSSAVCDAHEIVFKERLIEIMQKITGNEEIRISSL